MLIRSVHPRRVVRREAFGPPGFPEFFGELRRGLGAAPTVAPGAFVPRVVPSRSTTAGTGWDSGNAKR